MANYFLVYMRNTRGRRLAIPKGEVDAMLAQGWEVCAQDDIEEYRPDRDQSLVPLDQQLRKREEGENAQELELLYL